MRAGMNWTLRAAKCPVPCTPALFVRAIEEGGSRRGSNVTAAAGWWGHSRDHRCEGHSSGTRHFGNVLARGVHYCLLGVLGESSKTRCNEFSTSHQKLRLSFPAKHQNSHAQSNSSVQSRLVVAPAGYETAALECPPLKARLTH
jgi:hypothetical protein